MKKLGYLLFLFFSLAYTSGLSPTPQIVPSKLNPIFFDDKHYREFHKGQDAIDWWNSIYSDRIFTPQEKQIIFDYTFGNFSSINSKLRDGMPLEKLKPEEQNKVMLLDKALDQTHLFENFIVYRYENLGFLTRLIKRDFFFENIYKNGVFLPNASEKLKELIINKKYQDYGFMSTTMIRNSVFQTRPIELVIKAPRLSKAVFVSLKDLAVFQTQYELLFPRGKILLINDFQISEDNKKITIYVQMQPPCHYSAECRMQQVDNLKQPQIPLTPAIKPH